MTEIKQITENLRVRDYDHNQYVIETRSIVADGKNAGEERWTIEAYVGSVKSIDAIVEQLFTKPYVLDARRKAKAAWDDSGFSVDLSSLQSKPTKGENE